MTTFAPITVHGAWHLYFHLKIINLKSKCFIRPKAVSVLLLWGRRGLITVFSRRAKLFTLTYFITKTLYYRLVGQTIRQNLPYRFFKLASAQPLMKPLGEGWETALLMPALLAVTGLAFQARTLTTVHLHSSFCFCLQIFKQKRDFSQSKAFQKRLKFKTITCTCQTNAPLETFSGEMGGRTFSFFFVDLKIPEETEMYKKSSIHFTEHISC